MFSRLLSSSALLVIAAFSVASCKKEEAAAAPTKRPPVPVVVTEVVRKDMPVVVRAIGRVTSPATVSVKPQVTGRIFELHFVDGQDVKKGDPLFTIDKRPFEVALDQARASQAEAAAKAANAADQARRYASLDKTGSVSKDEVATFLSAAKAAEATVQVAVAAVKGAELQLDYCSVRAPINGRAGKALVTAGNVVSANQTELVVLNQTAPVEVTMSVAEQQLPAVQRGMAAGRPKVVARTAGAERLDVEGELTFVDNTVKAATGTVELKAAFKNEPPVLWPGQFVGLRVQVGLDVNAVVAPAAAVQEGQEGTYVFVVKEGVAEMRPVEVVRSANDEAVIGKGLEGGEQIVIDGQSRLTKGSAVTITPADKAPIPPPAATYQAAAPSPPPAQATAPAAASDAAQPKQKP
jgi:membrane fusion protein, multidrug efflux system